MTLYAGFPDMADASRIQHETFMKKALVLAEEALSLGEFPVGCVLVTRGNVISEGRRTGTSAEMVQELRHAEMNALSGLSPDTDPQTLPDLTLYCTMEPCMMCFCASVLSNVKTIVYAYEDVMGGGCNVDRNGFSPLFRDAKITIVPHILRETSLVLFQKFFSGKTRSYWKDSLLATYTLEQKSSINPGAYIGKDRI